MKLVVAIVHDEDANNIIDSLREYKYFVTRLSSTGGFLRVGNTTLICGVDDSKVEEAISIIESNGKSRIQVTPSNIGNIDIGESFIPYPIEVKVGGSTIFVLDVDQFKKF